MHAMSKNIRSMSKLQSMFLKPCFYIHDARYKSRSEEIQCNITGVDPARDCNKAITATHVNLAVDIDFYKSMVAEQCMRFACGNAAATHASTEGGGYTCDGVCDLVHSIYTEPWDYMDASSNILRYADTMSEYKQHLNSVRRDAKLNCKDDCFVLDNLEITNYSLRTKYRRLCAFTQMHFERDVA